MFYATGLAGLAVVRSRHRFDYIEEGYSLAEAFLWLGRLPGCESQALVVGSAHAVVNCGLERPFYWGT